MPCHVQLSPAAEIRDASFACTTEKSCVTNTFQSAIAQKKKRTQMPLSMFLPTRNARESGVLSIPYQIPPSSTCFQQPAGPQLAQSAGKSSPRRLSLCSNGAICSRRQATTQPTQRSQAKTIFSGFPTNPLLKIEV